MANVTAVIFDYYETLAELTLAMRERLFDDLARRVGRALPAGEGFRHWRENTAGDLALRLGGRRAPPDGPRPPFRTFGDVWLERMRQLFQHWDVEAAGELGADAYARMHENAVVYPDVPPALKALRGRYRLAVLSDADSGFLEASLRRNGLAFETVVVSDEMRAYKPHVSLFREVCDRLQVTPEQAVYVGDTPWADIEGARRAGMRAVWINRHDATWPDDIEPPATTVTSLAELEALLEAAGMRHGYRPRNEQ